MDIASSPGHAIDVAWTPKRQLAVELLATSDDSTEVIAEQVGVLAGTLCKWKREPAFVEKLREHEQMLAERWMERGLARRPRRLKELSEQYTRITAELEARGEMMRAEGDAMGFSGMVSKKQRQVGKGEDAQVVTEYEIDTATSRELRAILEQIARELGQWQDKRETEAASNVQVTAMQVILVQPGSVEAKTGTVETRAVDASLYIDAPARPQIETADTIDIAPAEGGIKEES